MSKQNTNDFDRPTKSQRRATHDRARTEAKRILRDAMFTMGREEDDDSDLEMDDVDYEYQ